MRTCGRRGKALRRRHGSPSPQSSDLFPGASSVSCRSNRVSESSIENGSSSSRNSGSSDRARASETHCCVPRESSAGICSAVRDTRPVPDTASRVASLSALSASGTSASRQRDILPRGQPRQQRRRLKDDAAIGSRLDHFLPLITTPPSVAFCSPAIIESTVDFPHPECPRMQTNSARCTLR